MPKDLSEHPRESLAGSTTHPKTSSSRWPPPSTSSSSDGVPNLLLKLLEACAKHKRRHDQESSSVGGGGGGDDDDKTSTQKNETGNRLDWCHNELISFARVLPRMEASIAVADTHCDEYYRSSTDGVEKGEIAGTATKKGLSLEDKTNDEDAVGHLCALYRAIARGAFCTHAVHYLFVNGDRSSAEEMTSNNMEDARPKDIDIAKGILPRMTKLLQFLALDPVRAALSPLKQPPKKHSSLGDSIKMNQEGEYVGTTIAALLNLLQDEQLRFSAVNDMINLSNDLSTIDESKALFDPPMSFVGGKEEEEGAEPSKKAVKIRVHVFTEVARLLRRRSNGSIENESLFDNTIQIPSRRSLLALQFGVWTALQHFVPLLSGLDERSQSPNSSFSAHVQSHKVDLLNSLLSSARSTSLNSLRPTSQQPRFLAWTYSPFDVMIHTLLMLRTKLAVVGLFIDVITWGDAIGVSGGMNMPSVSSALFPDMGALSLAPSINLALLAIESAKYHLLWGQSICSERLDTSQAGSNSITHSSRKLEHHLISMCSWAVSNLMSLSVLFPDKASVSKNDIWSHSFPYLLDCIPFMADSSSECSSTDKYLRNAVLRVIHAMLLSTEGSILNKPTPYLSYTSSMLNYPDPPSQSGRTSFIYHLRNRCLVKGYFSHLSELVNDSSESVSGPAISIVVIVLESFLDSRSFEDNNLVETACLNALDASSPDPSKMISDTGRDSPLVRLGMKRRKLEPCQDDKDRISTGASIQTTFGHAILDALVNAQNIIEMLVHGSKDHIRISGGPEVISLFSESEIVLLRRMTGVLRILLSMRSQIYDVGLRFKSTDQVIARLFQSVKRTSEVLARQKTENDKLIFVEPKLFNYVLSPLISVGLHACRVQNGSLIENLAAREALSYCAIATLPMIDYACGFDLDASDSSNMIAAAKTNGMCGGVCCRLASMIGAIARPFSDICLCRLIGETSERFERLESECGAFTFDDTLPLHCRCILLATMCPVASDSEHYDPTLSSIQCILANSADSQTPSLVKTALLGLPNLFLSLATRKEGDETASAKYLTMVIDTFCIENNVANYVKSETQGIKTNAIMSMARLAKVYTAASLVASCEHGEPRGDQLCNASSYLWQEINPAISGTHQIILSLLSIDGCFSFTTHADQKEHPIFSGEIQFYLTKSDSPQHWMANLVYLQSFLATVPESKIRSSNTFEFFSDKRHYDFFEKIAKELNGDKGGKKSVSAQVPCPVWLFIMTFFGHDMSSQTAAVKSFGRALLDNKCKVFSAFFIPESEMKANLNQISTETARRAVDKLFHEIDFMLGFCGLGRNLLFSRQQRVPHILDANVAKHTIGVFRSLCQWSPLKTAVGRLVLERSLLALIRIWVASSGGYAFNTEFSSADPTCHSSLASNAFDGLNEIFHYSSKSTEFLKHVEDIMSKIFSEFFLPPLQHTISAKTRYRLLTVFIGTFILPNSVVHSLRTQNTFEVSSVFEIMVFIDSVYPSVLVQMIKDEDHEAIQMCAAFRMYLLSEAKKLNKEEKRMKKKGAEELIVGTRQEKGSNSRSLVPGVSISTTKLIENAKLLCIKTDVISHVLPQLLLHPGRAPLRFFTTKVCQSELNYPDILREIGLPVLKTLVWELGRNDPVEDTEEEMYIVSTIENNPKRKDVRLALRKGFLLREGSESSKVKHLLMSPSQDSVADDAYCTGTAGSWIAPNFMYLLVNIVLHQWAKRNEREKLQVVKCLRAMLHFLPPSDSPQYMPQIMTAINNAISSSFIPGDTQIHQNSKLRFLAVATLFDYIKIVTTHNASQVGENLTTIIVSLFPLFNYVEPKDHDHNSARKHAVQMLEWLASGDPNKDLSLYFSKIPFLPFTHDLKKVRSLLAKKGVQLDDIRLMSQQTKPQGRADDDAQLDSKFYIRMSMLSQLVMSHENKNVREVVIRYMTDLIQANRDLFQDLILNEELSSMNFLTVVNPSSKTKSKSTDIALDDEARLNGGLITKLLIRLLSRCVDESDRDIRDAIATCLGEIGAIDPNRLGKEINSSQFVANSVGIDDSSEWRRSNPPWKTQVAEYQLRLVTRHLVSGLKSAPIALDQHKISFAIQELLKILDVQFGGRNESEMTPQLKERLRKADVSSIVEPFWSTNYKQVDTVAAKSPPFFRKSNSYFSWISSVCRYLVKRSNENKGSAWGDFFHACRSAIRSQAGIGAAEFLLPLFILDALCFGKKFDEDVIVDEFLHVLSFEGSDSEKVLASHMNLREREKAANVIFTVMDVLRHWLEKEAELRQQPSRGRSKRSNISNSNDDGNLWPTTATSKKIECFLKRIPLSSCALAASKVGMRARALQFLEVEGRNRAVLNGGNHKSNDDSKGVSKFLKSHLLDGIDLQLMQTLLGQLNDFDTMVFLAQKSHQADLTKRLTEEAAEREMCEDWEGAFQAYEQLLDSRLNDETHSNPNSAAENTNGSAQKGLLRCLLKLGRLDSVLNQSYGMSNTGQIDSELVPFATEAAWRLGKWTVLDNLVNNLNDGIAFDADARYQLSFGRTMHSLHSKSHAKVISCLKDSRESIMSSLSSAARDGYTRSYPYLMQLHSLREIECSSSLFFDDQSKFQESFIKVVSSDQWKDRLDLSTPDITGSNTILNTRLALARMAKQPTIEGSMWLNIGKAARKGGLYQVAEHSLTRANASFCKPMKASMGNALPSLARESIGNIKLQVAKLKHDIGESITALKLIEDDIPASIFLMDEKQLNSYVTSRTADESGEAVARRILQATEWMGCDGIKSSSEIKDRYETVLKLAPRWDKAHFNYAKFLDSLFETRKKQMTDKTKEEYNNMSERQKQEVDPRAVDVRIIGALVEYLLDSVKHYGIALQLGQKHCYQALPRMLAMWLEFTSLGTEDDNIKDDSGQNAHLKEYQELMNKAIEDFASEIPEHLFYTALPQLLSRVVHNNVETSANVALILRNVIAKYPHQSLWSCGWLRFSKSEEKKKAGVDIFLGAMTMLRKSDRDMLDTSQTLFRFLISIAAFVPKTNNSCVKMKNPKFETELKHFIPPIQAALSLSPGALGQSANADVFPSFVPRMRAFNTELRIMQSKAKPKKISFFAVPSTVAQRDTLSNKAKPISEDVGELHFLAKQEAKGDLRKDSRVQDLNNVINRIFASRKGSSGPNSRRRRLRLRLRTFSVVCLTEDCGILEWVPNTESLRSVITETYNPQFPPNSVHRRGSRITNFSDNELRGAFLKCQDVYLKRGDLDLATKKFDELILKQYLPVMYWWFIQNFASPHSWFEARTNFTLSNAVWSAVGHIIGLGDRHSENLLVDTSSGECVHVDFDCIFDKGLLLPRPEVIPFRLTPNMLDAFGPTGADGMYTGALTESMRTLRKNRDTLLSVLEPFLNDPVINFKSKSQQKSKKDNDANDAKKAMDSIAKIEGRLEGEYNLINPNKNTAKKNKDPQSMMDSTHFTKLSVEGQVQKMIMEATSHENLVQVYVGWMPWI